MKNVEIACYLQQYQNWRRDNTDPQLGFEAPEPQELGEVIDLAIERLCEGLA